MCCVVVIHLVVIVNAIFRVLYACVCVCVCVTLIKKKKPSHLGQMNVTLLSREMGGVSRRKLFGALGNIREKQ